MVRPASDKHTTPDRGNAHSHGGLTSATERYGTSTGTLSGGQVSQANPAQTITVTTAPPSSAAYNSTFPVAATASSGLAVAITTSGSCSGSGSSSATITDDQRHGNVLGDL